MSSLIATAETRSKPLGFVNNLFLVLVGSIFIALCAQISFYFWFSPIPVTLQTFAVLLIGASLGSKQGTLAVIAYLFEGALGLPVFTGGSAGLTALTGLGGGYLMGFIVCAYVSGRLLEKGWRESFNLTFCALAIGSLLILVVGVAWLSLFVGIGTAFKVGVLPFLVGNILKVIAALLGVPPAAKAVQWVKSK